MTDARQYAGGGPEMLNMNASVNDGGRPLAPASVERPSPRECQCPVRPWATLGAFGSGSAAEARAMDAWAAEHGAHPYARARDDLATALQLAEGRVGSIGAVMHMVADVFGLPRESIGEAARDNKRLSDMLCARLADYCGEGGRNEGAVDTLNRLLAELNHYRAIGSARSAKAAQELEAMRAKLRHNPHPSLDSITPQKVGLGEATVTAQQLHAPGKTFTRMEVVAIVRAAKASPQHDEALSALNRLQSTFENME